MAKEEIGRRCGRSRAGVSNLIRLLDLPDDVISMLERGELSEGHGRALLQARDRMTQRRLAGDARDRGWSVRETEAMARAAASGPARPRAGCTRFRPRCRPPGKRPPRSSRRRSAGRSGCGCAGAAALVEIPFDDLAELTGSGPRTASRLAA